jgi:hypothetical protein
MRMTYILAVLCQVAPAHADEISPHDAPPAYEPEPPKAQWLQPWTFGIARQMSGPELGNVFAVAAEYAAKDWLVMSGRFGWNEGAATGGAGMRARALIGNWAIGGGVNVDGVGERRITEDRSSWITGTDTLAYDFASTFVGAAEGSLEVRRASGFGARLGIGLATPLVGGSFRCTEARGNNGLASSLANSVTDSIGSEIGSSGPMRGMTTATDCGGAVSVAMYAGLTLTYPPGGR